MSPNSALPAVGSAPPLSRPSRTLVDVLREARWITRERVLYCGAIFTIISVILLTAGVVSHTRHGFVADNGEQLGLDFIAFYAAERAAAGGEANRVYDEAWLRARQEAVTGPAAPRRFDYPPVTMLLWLPLAFFSFAGALAAWVLLGAGACFGVLRRLIGSRAAGLAVVGTPAAFFTVYAGQNGYFTAALLGGGLLALAERPVLAGVCFGCLAYKPQMALMLPFALAAAGRWRTIAVAAAVGLLLVLASVALFGLATWEGFLGRGATEVWYLSIAETSHRMPTVFIALRVLGASLSLAFALQGISAFLALAAVVSVWRSSASLDIKSAVLVVATFLATPHAWDYDEMILVFAAAWLWRDALRTGFLAWERLAIVVLLVLPMPSIMFNILTGIEAGPSVLWLIMLLLLRRAGFAANRAAMARRALA